MINFQIQNFLQVFSLKLKAFLKILFTQCSDNPKNMNLNRQKHPNNNSAGITSIISTDNTTPQAYLSHTYHHGLGGEGLAGREVRYQIEHVKWQPADAKNDGYRS